MKAKLPGLILNLLTVLCLLISLVLMLQPNISVMIQELPEGTTEIPSGGNKVQVVNPDEEDDLSYVKVSDDLIMKAIPPTANQWKDMSLLDYISCMQDWVLVNTHSMTKVSSTELLSEHTSAQFFNGVSIFFIILIFAGSVVLTIVYAVKSLLSLGNPIPIEKYIDKITWNGALAAIPLMLAQIVLIFEQRFVIGPFNKTMLLQYNDNRIFRLVLDGGISYFWVAVIMAVVIVAAGFLLIKLHPEGKKILAELKNGKSKNNKSQSNKKKSKKKKAHAK